MRFLVGGLFGRKEVPAGPRIAGRTELGGEFSIGRDESFVVGDTIVTNTGMSGGRLALDLKVGDRNGRIEVPVNDPAKGPNSWYEYRISPVMLDAATMRAKMSLKKACDRAKPAIYDADFWLKAGESAAFEHGLVLRNKSTSRSKQGEFTNVTLEMEYQGQRRDVILVSFAKGKEKFVYAQMKNVTGFGPFDIRLNSASETDAVLNVHKGSELIL
ncbi:MAG: hypothetical protein FJY76_03040 [Candidatus Aenigmarchaeota archaeon]|nr:hypothetical protein [Candidatus Aenigmarchaeota archaeon]